MTVHSLAHLRTVVTLVAVVVLGPGGPSAPVVRAVTPNGAAGAAAQMDDAVVVRILSPQSGKRVSGRLDVAGFAADPVGPRGTDVNRRDVQIWLDD
jgi:hypothetical protein